MTLSGGDPLVQADFSHAILKRCRAEGLHTAVETSANCQWSRLEKLLPMTDLIIMDIKHLDPEKQRKAYEVYLRAQRLAVETVAPGMTMTKLENLMCETLESEGYEDYFIGPPIHGVGLEFEEPPLPAGHAFFHGEKPKDELKPGMVISIGNCGLYLGESGVRVEDTVVVTDRGYEELTVCGRKL